MVSQISILGGTITIDERNLIGSGSHTIEEFIEEYELELRKALKKGNELLEFKVYEFEFQIPSTKTNDVVTVFENNLTKPFDRVSEYSFIESAFYELFYKEPEQYIIEDDDFWILHMEEDEVHYQMKGTGKNIDEEIFNALLAHKVAVSKNMIVSQLLEMFPDKIKMYNVELVFNKEKLYYENDSMVIKMIHSELYLINGLAKLLLKVKEEDEYGLQN